MFLKLTFIFSLLVLVDLEKQDELEENRKSSERKRKFEDMKQGPPEKMTGNYILYLSEANKNLLNIFDSIFWGLN